MDAPIINPEPARPARASPLLPCGEAAAVLLLHVMLFALVFDISALPIGTDGFLHYRVASELSIGSLWVDISALPFTVLGESGPDHHWLIHWLQKPLTLVFGETPGGMAWATVVWAALVPASLTLLLRLSGIPFAWVIACVGVWGLYLMPDRLLMFRAQNAAIVMVVALGLLMSGRAYLKLAVFMFLFGHAYQGVILAGAVGLSALLAHAWVYREFDRHLVSAAVAGFILSLLTSPWFPDNIEYLVVMTLGRLLNQVNDMRLMGTEWLPLGPATLLQLGLVGHLCLLASWTIIFALGKGASDRQKYKSALLFALLATIFLVLYAKHWRMGEYYGPLSAVSLGFALALVPARAWRAAIAGAILLTTIAHQWLKHPEQPASIDIYTGQCDYLAANASEGDLVFNLPWPAFSHLYECQPGLNYVSGFDGLMLMHGSPDIFRVWYLLSTGQLDALTAGEVKAALARTNARFLLVGPGQEPVVAWLLQNIPAASVAHVDGAGYLLALEPLSNP